ncbi:MAG: hypothetical protein NTW25_06240 [Candidatus Kapabacteria bacterium]|nr:hypothetical protein [Candidatus Kapabacteria bacterium]
MFIIRLILLLAFLLFSVISLLSQGCSDAGVCSLNRMKPMFLDSNLIEKTNYLSLGLSNGKADHSISIIGGYLEYNKKINEAFSINSKLTFSSQNGNNINTLGISDLYLSTNYKLSKNISLVFGSKIPLSNGNTQINGKILPMNYQSSLGTLDLILGLNYNFNNFNFVFALQQPLTQNKNQFINDSLEFVQYQSTNKYFRNGDLMFRVSYPIEYNESLTISPSLLPIYHLSDDSFINIMGNEVKIIGSKGLTLNLNVMLNYNLNTTNAIIFSFGSPFVTRESRPDGLTRSYVANFEYRVSF